jgi:hypothetical protein
MVQLNMSAKGAVHKDECVPQEWEADYARQINKFKENHKFKNYIIATDSEFGPEWAVRNHSQKSDLLEEDDSEGQRKRKFEVPRNEDDEGYTFKEKVLYDDKGCLNIKQLKLDDDSEFMKHCREFSASKLQKSVSKRPQWYGSTSGPIWARLYSTVFWIYVDNDNGTTETHRLVFPWYIYRSEHVSLEDMNSMWRCGDYCWSQPQNDNRTLAERVLLRKMARCWIELISNAQYVIAWSQQGVDILNPLDWFVLNKVFQVTAEDRIQVLLYLGWNEAKVGSPPGDLTFSSKNATRYVDLSAAFPERKLEDASRRWLPKDSQSADTFKTLNPKQLDQLFAVADNRTEAMDTLCFDEHERQKADKLIFSRYDELCYHLTRHSLLAYNDMDVCLMHQLMSIGKSEAALQKVVPFMFDSDGHLKFYFPVSYSHPLVFASWHSDVRRSILAREKRARERKLPKRQVAMWKGSPEPEPSGKASTSRENPREIKLPKRQVAMWKGSPEPGPSRKASTSRENPYVIEDS